MTYIDYLNEFNRWLESNVLPGNAQLMFFKFLDVFNRAGWPEYVQVDNFRLTMMIDASAITTALRARDKLVEAGFLIYQKGKKGAPNRYSLKCSVKNETVSATISATENATISATENATHIKTKTKTKNTPLLSPQGGTRKRFLPPTVDEVREYCQARNNGIDPEAFVAFYASKGWKVGRSPMKDWKQAVITWEKRRKQEGEEDPYAKFT